jgi:hypothetical protein
MLEKIILGVGLALSMSAIQANPILVSPVSPDYYHCIGKNADVVFSKNATGTTTTLKIILDGVTYKVQNSDISNENSILGSLKEITIGFKPDVSITKATVIIPSIILGPLVTTLKFDSQLVVTTILKSMIMSAPQGITNKSKYIDLSCQAQRVNP